MASWEQYKRPYVLLSLLTVTSAVPQFTLRAAKEESEAAPVMKHGMTSFFSSSVISSTKVSVVLGFLERLGLGNAGCLQFR